MGVHGLWRLIEPSGKPVPLETLENKVLAVDISIWLHQAIRGFQDSRGAPLPNAHLLGIYHRVCKLLYFRVRPVFVFDGGVPALKKETIAKRNQQKTRALNEAGRIQKQLLTTLLKHSAVSKVVSEKIKAKLGEITHKSPTKSHPTKNDDELFVLPPSQLDISDSDSDFVDSAIEESTEDDSSSPTKYSLHTIDVNCANFKSLPVNIRHDILTDLKETRKQNSWGRIHEMPTHSGHFSNFQMDRLLKRRSVQVSLEEVEQEMGGHSLSLAELESLLTDQGIIQSSDKIGRRIASSDETRFVLIKDLKKALEEAKKLEAKKLESIAEVEDMEEEKAEVEVEKLKMEKLPPPVLETSENKLETIEEMDEDEIEEAKNTEEAIAEVKEKLENSEKTIADLEYEEDLKKAIQLSLQEEASCSSNVSENLIADKTDQNETFSFSFLDKFDDADFHSSSDEDSVQNTEHKIKKKFVDPVKSYMIEYSGLTPIEIDRIINKGKNVPNAAEKTKKTEKKNIEKAAQIEIFDIKNVEIDSKVNESNKSAIAVKETSSSGESILLLKDTEDNHEQTMKMKEKAIKSTEESSTDSDESDFLEVPCCESVSDVSTSASKNDIPKVETQKTEIIVNIKPDMVLEDDIFSDIFSSSKSESITKETQKKLSINLIKEHSSPTKDSGVNSVKDDEEIKNIHGKVDAEKHEKQITPPRTPPPSLSIEQLQEMKMNLVKESNELLLERSAKERSATNITDQMYQEAQELLQLFGVPYIVAPMEAEAQCAFLDDINLTDGTITDDSDVWLFGGQTVYKNFFNQDKHVLEFRAANIQHHFKLTRNQMILLALLVGSDYTTGIQGVGPVTALEILATFPAAKHKADADLTEDELLAGLRDFRNWLKSGRSVGPGRTALKSKLKNVNIFEGFPSLNVVKAYLDPTVESSKENFTWAKPDIVGLIDFAKEKFGWTQTKSEEILKPVIKRMQENTSQKSIKDFFKTKHKLCVGVDENKLSKRVKKALDKLGGKPDEEEKEKPKRKPRAKKTKQHTDESKEVAEDLVEDEDLKVLEAIHELSKKKMEVFKKDVKEQLSSIGAGTSNEKDGISKRVRKTAELHKKEVIPQKERDKKDILKSKMRAIETFRKSKQGPGFMKRRTKVVRQPKEDAGLSESSSGSDD